MKKILIILGMTFTFMFAFLFTLNNNVKINALEVEATNQTLSPNYTFEALVFDELNFPDKVLTQTNLNNVTLGTFSYDNTTATQTLTVSTNDSGTITSLKIGWGWMIISNGIYDNTKSIYVVSEQSNTNNSTYGTFTINENYLSLYQEIQPLIYIGEILEEEQETSFISETLKGLGDTFTTFVPALVLALVNMVTGLFVIDGTGSIVLGIVVTVAGISIVTSMLYLGLKLLKIKRKG